MKKLNFLLFPIHLLKAGLILYLGFMFNNNFLYLFGLFYFTLSFSIYIKNRTLRFLLFVNSIVAFLLFLLIIFLQVLEIIYEPEIYELYSFNTLLLIITFIIVVILEIISTILLWQKIREKHDIISEEREIKKIKLFH
ncbi:hypothetical protein KAU33_11370 [Candidatus Dependentiae bacterium]|nr:hypothetical protein [Candidatus Dependentiae bacterium]